MSRIELSPYTVRESSTCTDYRWFDLSRSTSLDTCHSFSLPRSSLGIPCTYEFPSHLLLERFLGPFRTDLCFLLSVGRTTGTFTAFQTHNSLPMLSLCWASSRSFCSPTSEIVLKDKPPVLNRNGLVWNTSPPSTKSLDLSYLCWCPRKNSLNRLFHPFPHVPESFLNK